MAQLQGWAFPVEVDETTGRIRMVEDEECVRQDIRLIVKTDQGERKMRSAFGAGINQFMFQNVDLVLVNQMSQTLAQSIKRWEEHIKGINVGVMQSTENRTAVTVDIQYVSDIDPIRPQQMRQEMELNQGDR